MLLSLYYVYIVYNLELYLYLEYTICPYPISYIHTDSSDTHTERADGAENRKKKIVVMIDKKKRDFSLSGSP